MGAATRGVLFFTRGAVAGTHYSAFFAAALSHANAAKSGIGEIAVVVRKMKMRFRQPGSVIGAEPQVFIDLVRLDQFARIHLPVGVPGRLELSEGLHELGPEHFRQQFRSGLTVTMLAG